MPFSGHIPKPPKRKLPPPPGPATVDPSQDEIWTTQDGRKLRVGEMDVDHLRSVLRMILKRRRMLRQLKRDLAAIANLTDDPFYDSDDK